MSNVVRSSAPRIERCTTAQVLPLRLAVLRDGTPSQDANYSEDELPGAVHLAIRERTNGDSVDGNPIDGNSIDGAIIATSTWIPRPYPFDEAIPPAPAVQLKGMAVAKAAQGTGLGTALLAAGRDYATALGAECVWARARDSALYFYEHHGFEAIGEQFTDEATGIGHHIVVTWLR